MNSPDGNFVKGLTEVEATTLLKRNGFNELPSQNRLSNLQIFSKVLQEPMLLLLVAAGLIYLVLGEISDAALLLGGIFFIVGITYYQEHKTERTLEALRRLSSPRALVIRDGKEKHIPGSEVVVGDFVVVREGDRIPADAVIMSGTNLLVNESLLTGESAPVRKNVWDGKEKMKRPGGDNLPFVFSGTLVTQGHAISLITSTGIETQMGKIGVSLKNTIEGDTLLKLEINRLVRIFAVIGFTVCLVVIVFYVIIHGNWLLGLLAGLTLSMALIPEEFSVVLVVFLTLGAWRIAKRKVLTRNSAAIETLGAVKVLCADKTGTLTQNKIQLKQLVVASGSFDPGSVSGSELPKEFHKLVKFSALACQDNPFDPMEKEIKILEKKLFSNHHESDWRLLREYPFSKTLMAITHVWQFKGRTVVAAKGAPESIIELCHLSKPGPKRILDQVHLLTEKGLRVLGVAHASYSGKILPEEQNEFKYEFLGLLGFADPIRSGVVEAVSESYAAGVRIIMITGDYPATAQFIAREAGIRNPESVVTGLELSRMDHLELRERIKNTNIFARVMPEQKLNLVKALKANDEVVGMTGDGVNDAPALKSANIGIAMGERGTDVAREAADLVLLNDDFPSIVQAVRLGRRIYDNLKKAVVYIAAVHVPIAGLTLLPLVFQMPIVLLPAHIAFLELIIDPACSVVFESEKEEINIMNRPPRDLREHLLGTNNLFVSTLQGVSILAIVFTVYLLGVYWGKEVSEIRTLTFVTLVFANLMLIITNLSWTENAITIITKNNQTLWWILGGTVVGLFSVLYIPFLRSIFRFSPLHAEGLLLTLFAGIVSILWFEVLKMLRNKSRVSVI